mmetsp:Transcript_15028/g.50715  ORF Transcript_15028/g.50715 Transcript_15028/m.50715 type:complete len:211 (-) Transcript_15028:340-972(-)
MRTPRGSTPSWRATTRFTLRRRRRWTPATGPPWASSRTTTTRCSRSSRSPARSWTTSSPSPDKRAPWAPRWQARAAAASCGPSARMLSPRAPCTPLCRRRPSTCGKRPSSEPARGRGPRRVESRGQSQPGWQAELPRSPAPPRAGHQDELAPLARPIGPVSTGVTRGCQVEASVNDPEPTRRLPHSLVGPTDPLECGFPGLHRLRVPASS